MKLSDELFLILRKPSAKKDQAASAQKDFDERFTVYRQTEHSGGLSLF